MKKTLHILVAGLSLLALAACGSTGGSSYSSSKGASKSQSQGNFKVGNPYKVDGKNYTPQESYTFTETGIASWYGPGFHGKRTANGEVYDQYALTAAHKTLQMPSLVRVTNLENGRSIIVRINDRGPFSRGRVIDMSQRGAELLQFKGQGTAKVKIQVLGEESRAIAEAAKRGVDVSGVEIAMNEGKGLDSRFASNETFAPANDHAYEESDGITLASYQPQPAYAQQGGIPSNFPEPAAGAEFQQGQTASINSVQSESLQAPSAQPATQPIASNTTSIPSQDLVRTMPVTPTNIYVQTGSFSSPDNANALASRLQTFGNAQVVTANVNGQVFHRVRLGPVSKVAQADQILSSLASNGFDKAIIVVE
jgi:rare lipoprotein A